MLLLNLLLLLSLSCSAIQSSPDPSLSDWLVTPTIEKTTLTKNGGSLRLSNGLIWRDFLVEDDTFATLDLYSVEAEASLLRALGPEATIAIGDDLKIVGGVNATNFRGYLNRSELAWIPFPNSLKYLSYKIQNITSDILYEPRRGAPASTVWPPAGLDLAVTFQDEKSGLTVVVHEEMYDGLPLTSKWMEVVNSGSRVVDVGMRMVEQLALEWEWSPDGRDWLIPMASEPHGNSMLWSKEHSVPGARQPVLQASYSDNFTVELAPGESLPSFRLMLLVVPSDCRERRGLAQRRMMRVVAPWTQESPIFFHLVNSTSPSVREVLDQMAQVGFEMLIYSFGSGFDLESVNTSYIEQVAADIAYANSLGIEVGGYDLIALTRQVEKSWMAVNNDEYPSACMASDWFDSLSNSTSHFIQKTGLSMLETDGPYGGYNCSARNHTHHKGLEDSVFQQNRLQSKYYRILRNQSVYINQPDEYYFQGGNKGGMGYSEDQFSLPRWQDLSLSRQTVYDNTFTKIPSMGWMFMPLVQYHAGGDPAIFEPLATNLKTYSWGLGQYLGGGVAACYRGYRLYDTDQTKEVVRGWVQWYKKHREILSSDIIHVKRPNMQGLDAWLHVNSQASEKGLLMVFNPTLDSLATKLTIPLYYTGIVKTANISERDGDWTQYTLSRDYKVELEVLMKPESITWFLIK